MRHFELSRDKRGWRYRQNKFDIWRYFPDSVQEKKNFYEFLRMGGYDQPEIVFTDESGKPSDTIELKREGVSFQAVANGERSFTVNEFEILPADDLMHFFTERMPPETAEELTKVDGTIPKLMFLKKSASQEVLSEYSEMVAEKMTDESIKGYFANYNGKQPNIHFI